MCATVNSQCLEYLGCITLVTKIWHQITITAVHGRGVGAVEFVETKKSSCLGFVLHILFENKYHKMLILSELEWNFCVGFSWKGLQVTHMVFAYRWTS